MRQPRTLRGRLSLAALAVATVSIVVLTTVFNLLLVRRLNGQAVNVLRADAVAAAATVTVRPDDTLAFADTREFDLNSGIWIFEGDHAVETPPSSAALQAAAAELVGTNHRLLHRDTPTPVALYSLAIVRGHRQVGTVVSAISLAAYRRSTRLTIGSSVVLAVGLLVVVLVLARTLVGRALAPVQQMTSQARTWSEAGTSERFGQADRPGELAQLAATLDELLDRLSAVLRREQQLSAEISHELRTPLSGIVAETELFATRPRSPEEASAAIATIRTSALRMEGILETLLSEARAHAGVPRGRCDAHDVVTEAVAALGAPRVPVHVDCPARVVVGLDQSVAERALAPLLANAVRHASSAVQVQVVAEPTAVRVEVKDDGPGVPAQLAEEVFEPGFQVDREHGGAGLGLALARRLAQAAGGDVVCRPGTQGWFVLTLPRG